MLFHQPLRGSAEALFAFAADMPVIDTHEHIPLSEQDYNGAEIRFGNLFNPYVSNDLNSAGMPFPEGQWPAFVCIEDDWDAFAPHWEAVKWGSYARPVRLALQKYYGVDDFTRENYREIVKRISENNTPGIYDRIYRQDCNIQKVIPCSGALPAQDDPLLVGNISSPSMQVLNRQSVEHLLKQAGVDSANSLDEFLEAADQWMAVQAAQGAKVFKTAAFPQDAADEAVARTTFDTVMQDKPVNTVQMAHLQSCVRDRNARKAAELDIPMAIHTGVWEDFRDNDIHNIIGFIQRNPATRMDVYHMGIPYTRAAVLIAKNFPNAWMNLCWSHIVAPEMVVQSLKEALDLVPLNKVIAFGADYVLFIEKVYGHLHMAKENIALVLGDRVDRDLMDLDTAKQTMRAWFYDTPLKLYNLEV